MTTLADVVRQLTELLEKRGIPYAVMGGLAVRVHGIPRPTHDVDLTVDISREKLATLFSGVEELGYSVPEAYRGGWVDQVGDMPLVKFRLQVQGHAIDIDLFLAESPFQMELLSRRQRLTIDEYDPPYVSNASCFFPRDSVEEQIAPQAAEFAIAMD